MGCRVTCGLDVARVPLVDEGERRPVQDRRGRPRRHALLQVIVDDVARRDVLPDPRLEVPAVPRSPKPSSLPTPIRPESCGSFATLPDRFCGSACAQMSHFTTSSRSA